MNLRFLDYRYADAVLGHATFSQSKQELIELLGNAPVPLLNPVEQEPRRGGVKRRRRPPLKRDERARYFFLPVDQKAINVHLDGEFEQRGWETRPPIVSRDRGGGPETGLKGDYKKGRVQVEIQFGNMARWYAQ